MLLPGPDGIANAKATAGARFSSPGPRGSLFQGFLQPHAPRVIPMVSLFTLRGDPDARLHCWHAADAQAYHRRGAQLRVRVAT